jgi:hypothetical protein
MSYEKFESRLHEVLDDYRRVDGDVELTSLAAEDSRSREELQLYEALFDGLDARNTPEPPAGFADRVLAEVRHGRRGLSGWTWAGISLAVAAALLVAMLPRLLDTGGDPGVEKSSIVVALAPFPRPKLVQNPSLRGDPLSDDYLARAIGDAVAAWPGTEQITVVINENPVVEGIRPVATSVSAAFDALRGALPRKSIDSKSSLLVRMHAVAIV